MAARVALLLPYLSLTILGLGVAIPSARGDARYLVVIGVDGLSPDGIQHADAPNFRRLRERGAWTYHARGVMPTSSSPNWASMIMGAGPEQHGITSNDWQPDKFDIPPTVRGPGGIFPTIFGVLRAQSPASVIGLFHDWDGFGRLVETNTVDVMEHPSGPTNTTLRAIEFIEKRRPTLTFIHLDNVDHIGHEKGHGTPAYYAEVGVADKLIGQVLSAIQSSGLESETLVLVTADHGGRGTKHGEATMPEIEIPWILAGPGVRAGHEIQSPVATFDTAATIAFALGLKAPEAWLGRPVREAFSAAAK